MILNIMKYSRWKYKEIGPGVARTKVRTDFTAYCILFIIPIVIFSQEFPDEPNVK